MRFGVMHLGRSGAGGQLAAAAANGLAADGHNVQLVIHENFRGQIRIDPGVEATFVQTYFRESRLGYINPVAFARVLRTITRLGPQVDVWYLPMPHFWMPLLLPVMRHYAPIVTAVHEVGEKDGEKYSASRQVHRIVLRADIHFSHLLVTHSSHVQKDLERVTGAKSVVVPLPPIQFGAHPPAPQVVDEPHQPLRLLMYGRFEAYKGVDIAIEAVRAVESSNPGNVELHLVGRWPSSTAEANEESSRSSEPWLHQSSAYLTEDELCQLIRSADVLLAPYLDATQSAVVTSAFAEFRPVIVTNVGGLVEQVARDVTGLVCEPNADSLAAAITRLVENPELIVTMSRNISEYVKGLASGPLTAVLVDCANEASPNGSPR